MFVHVERAALARFVEDLVRGREITCIIKFMRESFVCGGGNEEKA